MKRIAAVRITADICFYYSILGLVNALAPYRTAMACFTALAFFAAALAQRLEHSALRALPGLLAGIPFFFAPLRPIMIVPALAWLYLFLLCALGGFHEGLYEYRGRFRIMLVAAFFFVAANLANIAIYRGRVLTADGLVYLFLFMTLGVIALRQMQMGAVMGRNWQLSNSATVFLTPLLAVGVSFGLFYLLKWSVPLWKAVLAPGANLILWLFMKLFGKDEELSVLSTPMPSVTPAVQHTDNANLSGSGTIVDDRLIPEMVPGFLTGDVLTPLAYFLAALTLIAALWLIWTLVRRAVVKPQGSELYYEDTELQGAPRRLLRRRTPSERSNARRVRRIYQDYLLLQRHRGSEIQPATTSEDVLEQTARAEADETLRRIYIAARYRGEISAEDAETAQRCYEEICRQTEST